MAFDKGHALVIGVGSHRHAPRLDARQTAADAHALASVLRDEQYCGYPDDQVELLQDQSANAAGILAALDRLAGRVKESDTVVIFYSGHGEYGADGNYYLVSHDAQLKDRKVVTGTGVSQVDLLKRTTELIESTTLL